MKVLRIPQQKDFESCNTPEKAKEIIDNIQAAIDIVGETTHLKGLSIKALHLYHELFYLTCK